MNGAEMLIRTALAAGVEVCFANPGTTEMPLVAACDHNPAMRSVLGLFEGVCTGAADGYARMADKPALTMLHLGPGLANGLANLHNARRARSPVVNVVGEHASWHVANDPPLNSDIVGLAQTVSGWVRTCTATASMGQDMADAIAAATQGQVATLIVPNDYQLAQVDPSYPLPTPTLPQLFPFDEPAVAVAVETIRRYTKTALVLGGRSLRAEGLHAARRVQAATGCDLLCESFPSRLEWGAGLPNPTRIPYFPEQSLPLMSRYQAFVLVDAPEPVVFFGYPGLPGRLIQPGQAVVHLSGAGQDPVEALDALAEALHAPAAPPAAPTPPRPTLPRGRISPENAIATLAALQPENAIIVNEGVTTGRAYPALAASAPPHTQVMVTGGAIGFGIPCAVGAALACPDRPVINLQADGSAMYTLQGLWTQARERLHVITLLCANHKYQILETELARAGIPAGAAATSLTSLERPPINWVALARGMGVDAIAVLDAEDLVERLTAALAEPRRPHLIELAFP
jgi:acetolactate synthase-1/2/3 large subunit